MTALLVMLQIFILRSMREHDDTVSDFLQQRRGRDPLQAFYASRIHRIQKWSLCLSCLLCLLCVRTSSLRAEEALVTECGELLTQIVDIQTRRAKFQDGANALMTLYERGTVSKKELDNSLRVWYIVENELKEEVTGLYDIAHKKKCFDEKLNESR